MIFTTKGTTPNTGLRPLNEGESRYWAINIYGDHFNVLLIETMSSHGVVWSVVNLLKVGFLYRTDNNSVGNSRVVEEEFVKNLMSIASATFVDEITFDASTCVSWILDPFHQEFGRKDFEAKKKK